jgi:phosphate starvation-inducible PhoH-like protein
MTEASITLGDQHETTALLGVRDQHLRKVRDTLGVRVQAREGQLWVQGEPDQVSRATLVFARLKEVIQEQGSVTSAEVNLILEAARQGQDMAAALGSDVVQGKRRVRPRTEGQARFVRAARENDVVLCVGPAGTGKTYLAVAMAAAALTQGRARRLVLVRPAVEAGERLGFLPGDLVAKVHPYLRPLLDALHDILDFEQVKRYLEADLIEIVPLAYMRGRTLNDAVIILDEGQNTTVPQMKMFLTRMGQGSKIIVTGDITQIDLPPHTRSGLIDAVGRLNQVKGIEVVRLSQQDIVRHPLVQAIVDAYADDHSPRAR